jgi:hypothetical protein
MRNKWGSENLKFNIYIYNSREIRWKRRRKGRRRRRNIYS